MLKIQLNTFTDYNEVGHGLQSINHLGGDIGETNHVYDNNDNLPDGKYIEVCKCHPIGDKTKISSRVVEISNEKCLVSYELDITIYPDFDKEKESIGDYLYNFGK